jgi:hypothetical protein
MDFALTDRQAHFRNKVRDFMEESDRRKAGEYLAQSSSQPRWKVLPVLEDLEYEGADEVHSRAIARAEFARYAEHAAPRPQQY